MIASDFIKVLGLLKIMSLKHLTDFVWNIDLKLKFLICNVLAMEEYVDLLLRC